MSNSFNLFEPVRKPKRKKYLVEFRAGKMKLNEDNWVYPDKRKGLVYIHQSFDGQMHFCWKDRVTGKVEDDIIITPNESIFKRLPECHTGRVYLLKFKDSNKLFLWMQEPREDNDTEMCRKVNELLNQKPYELESLSSRPGNINDLTDLLGGLNEIGVLNDIDIIEILANGFNSQISQETDFLAATSTTPFLIGSNVSLRTDAEQMNSQPSGTFTQLNKLGTSSLQSHSSKEDAENLELFDILSDSTLEKLSKNKVFKRQILNEENSKDSILFKKSENYQRVMKTFCEVLSDKTSRQKILTEMGLPDSVIVRLSEINLLRVLQELENYFSSLTNKP